MIRGIGGRGHNRNWAEGSVCKNCTAGSTRVRNLGPEFPTALLEVKKAAWLNRAAAWGEGWIDYIDSVHRTNASRCIADDLVNRRITYGRASLEMRKLVGRIKGGWLAKAIRKSRK